MPDTMMQPEAPAYENRSASLAKLAEARGVLSAALPDEPLYGYLPAAGFPKNFSRAARS